MTPEPDKETPRTALDKLGEQELAVWSHLHRPGKRRPGLRPLTPAEQAEFAPFAAVLERARNAGFRGVHLVLDGRGKDENLSELKVFRERADRPTEVIVFCSTKWAHAFRVPRGVALLGEVELEEEPGQLLDLVLTGAWPEKREEIVTEHADPSVAAPRGENWRLKRSARITAPQRAQIADRLRERYAQGASIRALASETGRSYGFVHRLLTETGVVLRGRGGANHQNRRSS